MTRHDRPDHAEEIRHRLTDPVRLCQQLGLTDGYKPERQARGLIIRCPAHADRTPSCSVRLGPDGTIAVKCQGCGFAGNVHHLIAAAHRLDVRHDFPAVLEVGAGLAGISLDSNAPHSPRPAPARPAPPPAPPAVVDAETFRTVALALLEACPLAGSVGVGLASRGILAEAIADGWGELPRNVHVPFEGRGCHASVGFDLDSPAADELVALLRGRFDARALCWVLGQRGGLAHPDHRLLIPWRNRAGEVWGLQQRYAPLYGDEKPPEEPVRVSKYRWPKREHYSPAEAFPYGADSPDLAGAAEVWIVEGAPDVLALRAINRAGLLGKDGPRSMVALGFPGVQTWKACAPRLLEHVRGRVVRVALDADKAGRAAVKAIGEDAWRAGARDVEDTAPPPGAKDWAELSARLFWQER